MKNKEVVKLLRSIVQKSSLEGSEEYIFLKMAVDRLIVCHSKDAEFRFFINTTKGISFRNVVTKYLYNREISRGKTSNYQKEYLLTYSSEAGRDKAFGILSAKHLEDYLENEFSIGISLKETGSNITISFEDSDEKLMAKIFDGSGTAAVEAGAHETNRPQNEDDPNPLNQIYC